jgi:RimJ/RimL family protein N-acetyltransferase
MESRVGAESADGHEVDPSVDGVALAPVRREDLSTLYEWINDRDLVVLNAPYRPVPISQHEEWFEAVQRRPDAVLQAIRLTPSGKLIGTAQLHSIHPVHRSAELQIRIGDPQERGKGYGTAALRLVLRLAFDDLNLHRVMLHVFADNTRAIRTYEKLGFVREGVLRHGAFIAGRYVDVVVMAVLREEYRAQP